jgi:hypothetical protein
MTPSFRSSGVLVQQVAQKDGRHEIVVVQVNIVPVTTADQGAEQLVARAVIGTINDQNDVTMNRAEIMKPCGMRPISLRRSRGS